MLALIISDTHGDDSRILTIRRSLSENLDVLIHAGDIGGSEQFYRDYLRCQCHIVCGNTDWSGRLPETDIFSLGSHRVFLTHGHRYHVDFAGPEAVADAARQNGCDIAIFGHTHVPLLAQYGGVLVMNPGSLSRPRQPGYRPTYILLRIDDRTGKLHPEIKNCP
jgi:putative phosphoesterase